ncbi:hypothetical protein [Persicitalea jodogahamensis]|uniref:hypothetical protein n=1 Tax=Persicitalea jodogahamensis TaxID=402147 RepID=UPI00167BB521|nr:hypothetical protein [Persicitalea jodogahamensis]
MAFLAIVYIFLQRDARPPRMMLEVVPAFPLVLVVGLTPLGHSLLRQASLSSESSVTGTGTAEIVKQW